MHCDKSSSKVTMIFEIHININLRLFLMVNFHHVVAIGEVVELYIRLLPLKCSSVLLQSTVQGHQSEQGWLIWI